MESWEVKSMETNFYQSKNWINLISCIKLERQNAKGEIICEFCGKPIIKKYDCIAHHKEELNELNVHDATVALNPENIMLLHHKCHNHIHGKATRQKQVYLVWGSPCAGKTTWVANNMSEGDLIVDIDRIWQCVSGQAEYIKPNRLKRNVFAVRDLLIEQVKTRVGQWNNAYIVGGYPYISERERLIKQLGARSIYIDVTKEECLRHLKDAQDGRDKEKWKEYIEEWWRISPTIPNEMPWGN